MDWEREQYAWDRLEGETSKDYQAFCLYRDLGAERSIRKVSEATGIGERYLFDLKRKFDWDERIRKWEKFQEDYKLRKRLESIDEMEKRHLSFIRECYSAIEVPLRVFLERIQSEADKLRNMNIDELFGLVAKGINVFAKLVEIERVTLRVSNKPIENFVPPKVEPQKLEVVYVYPPEREREREEDHRVKQN
jgi:hypothetical protein